MDNAIPIDNTSTNSESLNNSDRLTEKYNTPNLHHLTNGTTINIDIIATTLQVRKETKNTTPIALSSDFILDHIDYFLGSIILLNVAAPVSDALLPTADPAKSNI